MRHTASYYSSASFLSWFAISLSGMHVKVAMALLLQKARTRFHILSAVRKGDTECSGIGHVKKSIDTLRVVNPLRFQTELRLI